MFDLTGLINKKYLKVDDEKLRAVTYFNDTDSLPVYKYSPQEDCRNVDDDYDDVVVSGSDVELKLREKKLLFTQFCPKCGKKYTYEQFFCPDCLVSLKSIGKTDIRSVKTNPLFPVTKTNTYDFDNLFCEDNFKKISDFDFTIRDFESIKLFIKKTSLYRLNDLIKSNEVNLNNLELFDKILLYAKSFAEVDFKSYGQELGTFKFNRITLDERPVPALQITTLIHELSHFIIKEFIAEIICEILDCSKNSYIEAVAVFILSSTDFCKLIDEYAAHSVEASFTLYGFQDYSSFIQIERKSDMSRDEIEITKAIGNTFANSIKEILESFIDDTLKNKIKIEFISQIKDEPNYEMLKLENCNNLTDEGFLKALWLIINDGFLFAGENMGKLNEYESLL